MKYFDNKKILVTGGAGFIGSNLVKKLVEYNANVSVIDNLWRGSMNNLLDINNKPIIDIKTNFHNFDLTLYTKCVEFIKGFDFVYHLADVVAGIDFVFKKEPFVFRQNILINSNTLAACVENNIPNYIYVGTACSFPKHLQDSNDIVSLIEEDTYPANPESSYGWSKLMGEYEAIIANLNSNINVGLLRLHNVYGPAASYDSFKGQVIPSLIRKAVNYPDEEFIVWGSGKQYRDFVFIDDVINALLLVPEKGMNNGLIQIGTEIPTTIEKLSKTIIEISKKIIIPIFDTSKPEGDKGRISNCKKARKILNWNPSVDIYNGIKKTYISIMDDIIA